MPATVLFKTNLKDLRNSINSAQFCESLNKQVEKHWPEQMQAVSILSTHLSVFYILSFITEIKRHGVAFFWGNIRVAVQKKNVIKMSFDESRIQYEFILS